MAQVRKTDKARDDLENIWLHIAQHNVDAATRLLQGIEAISHTLAENPRIGRMRRELGYELRSFPAGSYVIFYRPIEGGVSLIRVRHAARDIKPDMFRSG